MASPSLAKRIMNLRNVDRISFPANRTAKRAAFRIEISRASLLIGGLVGALMSALYFTLRPEPITSQEMDTFVFGKHTRVGSIVSIPMSGDNCRRAAFNNDNGVIIPLGEISCVLVIERADDKSNDRRTSDKFAAISDKFRK